ncbi:MAG TPA: hypothetical protein VMA32_00430 [Streptosporangiaceae bacterium]|nr:hypothetical protein [Streptosporangiaceae bacterium]
MGTSDAAAPDLPSSAAPTVRDAADRRPRQRAWPRWLPETMVVTTLIVGGIAATWPRATYLTGKLPLDGDQMQYVWDFWWVARQVTHFGNPWFTGYMAAPAGVQLGYDTLMPLVGLVMTPVTLLFGPAASYTLIAIIAPGLAAYAMYRAAGLWLPSRTGAIAAGAFYGYSAMLTSQAWLHVHTAMGCVLLPLTLEAAVRLRRRPDAARGVVLGLVAGGSILVDQEMAVLAVIVAVLALLPWLLRRRDRSAFWAAGVAAVSAVVVASPQLVAMARAGGKGGPLTAAVSSYLRYSASLPDLFAPSPHLASYGLTGLSAVYGAHLSTAIYASHAHELAATFGVVLTATALAGVAAGWRRRGTKALAVLWLGSAILSLGPSLDLAGREYLPLATTWNGIRVSLLMPYTWLIRMPVLSSFREADRLALLGLVGAALLAGAAVDWLRWHGRPLIILVAALAALEAGWSGIEGDVTVPTALPALDGPIAADHSGSVVVDVPFIVRGPEKYGTQLAPYALNLATADGHPRAISFSSGVPQRTIEAIKAHAFYAGLVAAERDRTLTSAQVAAARRDLPALHVGWVLIWLPRWVPRFPLGPPASDQPDAQDRHVISFLTETGFAFDYRADGVLVYRPAAVR